MWDEMRDFIRKEVKDHERDIVAIGSGGNINKVFSMSKRRKANHCSLNLLKDYYRELSSFSLADRMRIYKLSEDRADVIVPAISIYINVMRWANITEILCSQDRTWRMDMIQHLYLEMQAVAQINNEPQ